jgi:formylglycine-generating enzyme required for sulfatase activity/calcineurin-like phosphoesterase family protein
MMSEIKIKILHLSDIHFRKGKEDNKGFRQQVRGKLIAAVKKQVRENGSPDFVAVTGDIAFSGKKGEYKEAEDFFGELLQALPGTKGLLPVPGNHDVDRDEVDEFLSLYDVIKQNRVDEFLGKPKQVMKKINVKFTAFRNFFDKLKNNAAKYEKKEDYFWVKNIEDKKVSILGLNSSWACEGDNDRFNIALGYRQVLDALDKAQFPHRIALQHHPPIDWLKDMAEGNTRKELFEQCQLLLYGHVHADDALVYRDPSTACICLGANASYTHDGYIGFQFLEATFNETGDEEEKSRGVSVTVWPYILDKRRNDFVPDRERWKNQKGKPYFTIETTEVPTTLPQASPELPPVPTAYGKWLEEFHSTVPLEMLAKKGEVVMISLPAVYISLETTNPFFKPTEKEKDVVSEEVEEEPGEKQTKDIEELLGRVCCMLLRGNAGTGKTTLVKHLAYSLTHGSGPDGLKGYLPLLIFLKELWSFYKEALEKNPQNVTLEPLLERYFENAKCPLTMEIVNAYLAHNRALVLIDGLDEVPEDIRPHLVELLHRFQFQHKDNRFLLTGRPHGIEGKAETCFRECLRDIEPLNKTKSNQFIERWFRAVAGQAVGDAGVNANDMIADIRHHEHAKVFTGNPLLLTALCIFYVTGGKRIPDQRADLYDRIVGNLLYRRFHQPGNTEQVNLVRQYLMRLAFFMQEQNTKNIEPAAAREMLKETYPLEEKETPVRYKERLVKEFNGIEPVCGLLNRLSSGDIQFVHLSFQEFLSAKYMLDMDTDYKKYLNNSWWNETLLLYTGLMNLDMKTRSNTVARDMMESPAYPIQLLGARALRDFQASKRDEPTLQFASKTLCKVIQSDASLEQRFEAGEILGELGDPRINPLEPEMVFVEAGEFTMGSDKYDDEKPVRQVDLDAFEIGKYPVTNMEYKAFIEDGGYNEKKYWTPEGWQWRENLDISVPRFWHDRKWNGPNFPVVGVSWYEALAYAKWLSKKTGNSYTLPNEEQWEKAARGTDGRTWPWGNEFDEKLCNSWESRLERTSPVGVFPQGKSTYGCLDMAGNVWEWMANLYRKDKNRRSLRGGSWGEEMHSLRCSVLSYYDPYLNWADTVGFRVLRAQSRS